MNKSDEPRTWVIVSPETFRLMNSFPAWINRDEFLFEAGIIPRRNVFYKIKERSEMAAKTDIADEEREAKLRRLLQVRLVIPRG